ncbi:cold-shock DEAD-box protein A [Agrilactobacillus composti DSM 18527 = JCM 14202]|uniref:DEAD/DEAH box helicase n=1 Tax=Agrilactobacillus composti TaxID=398555 RepID=UPI00042E0ABD|nr:DEAD/DEAH box helicase [Agrilactobacillus composti]GAF39448.1 cold-shock DEAD-box protein A [Agrilactobacillus composti DSM 18527 = JCM 14202]
MKFEELNLDPALLEAVQSAGFEEATPIQAGTIPLVMAGKDVIGQAQTGTGKTAAFGLSILNDLDMASKDIQALIISPTRELAIQTQEELYRLGQVKKTRVQVVYGGADIRRQIRGIQNNKPQVIVGTPGRLLDLINRKALKIEHIKTLVLDEADEMLDMGFIEDIEKILTHVPNDHQTLLFSATMPAPIMRISEKFMNHPEIVKIKSKELTSDLIDQYYVRAKDFEKFDIMTRLFDVQNPDLALVFGRTKRRVDELAKGLQARGYRAEGIHGDLTQQKRMAVLRQFKKGDLDILVATDVAARGLDISGVTHVYNYDIPQDPDSYVHRIGRTGRAGKTGMSVTFVTNNEMSYLKTIEQLTKKRMKPLIPPTDQQAFKGQLKTAVEEINDAVEGGDLERFEATAEDLLEQFTPLQLASAYLKTVSKDATDVPVKITPERPLPNRKGSHKRSSSRNGHSNYRHGGGKSGFNKGNKKYGDRDRNHSKSNRSNSDHNHESHGKRANRKFTIRTNA